MKTAEISLEEIFPITSGIIGIGWHQIDQKQKDELIEAIKEHAKQVAQKALEDVKSRLLESGLNNDFDVMDAFANTPLIIE